MPKNAMPLRNSNRGVSWGSPIQIVLAVILGGLGGGSVYWIAERIHAKDVAPAATLPFIMTSTAEDAVPPPATATSEPEPEPEPAPAKEAQEKPATAATPSDDEAEAAKVEIEVLEEEDEGGDEANPERALLLEARSKFRSGDTFGAQKALEQMRKRFPKGSLVQPRELLYIQTQQALGAHAAAKKSARAFATAYPNSPYLASLEKLLLEP